MKIICLFFILTINFFHGTLIAGENILVVMPVCFPSHFRSFKPFLEELIRRGHNLTMLSRFPLAKDLQTKYYQVDVPFDYCHAKDTADIVDSLTKRSRFTNMMMFSNFYFDYTKEVFKVPQVQHLIQSKDHYDLVIAELFFMDVFFALGYKFDAPTIALCPFNSIQFFYSWTLGNPYPSSYIPNQFLTYSENMSLLNRISNLLFNYCSVAWYEFVSLPRTQSLMEKYFNFDKAEIPDMKAIMKNISLVLVNSHYSFGSIKPEFPNVLNIAGLHFSPSKPLPQNIKKFMDEAANGVIYLSMGSSIRPSDIKYLGSVFIRELSHLPQRIVMKWDPQLLPEIPDNILVEKWIPQVDILNHPNCKLFITHGGLHSTFESINASVPVVGIPIYSDQYSNMAAIENYGVGKVVLLGEVSAKLSADVKEVLHNPIYKTNMKKRSLLFRERFNDPLETAIFWTEHVIKHKDTSHLQSTAIQLTWYQLHSLDVLGTLGIAMFLIVYILKSVIVWIKGSILSKKSVKKTRRKED